jgi:predicted nucleic acid-binding protein
MVLLDTNILSEPLRKTPHRKVHARLGVQAGNFAASMISLNELRYGAMLHPHSEEFWSKIETAVMPLVRWMPIDRAIALSAADLRAYLQRKGQTAGAHDCLIAATALVHDLVLVTRNTNHFKQMPGLQLENWFI